ncbi:MAG: SDR family NAD(P)-dependent oxidoreductase [Planctomycetota bacterium]
MNSDNPSRTAVLSGSTGGIGTEIATLLASRGWNLVLVNRSSEKSQTQAAELGRQYPGISIDTYKADLLDQTTIVRACDEISKAHPRLSAIYNVAGLLTDNRITSVQGIEGHFAINTVAPYLFTRCLRNSLEAGKEADETSVVVNFGSSAVNSVKKLDVPTMVDPPKIGGLMGAYATSKLALMAVTLAMIDRQANSGVLFVNADPGPTKTSMTGSGDGMPWFIRLLRPLIFKSADVQAKRLVDGVEQAVADRQTGLYISEGRRKPNPKAATDKVVQDDLMNLLESLTPSPSESASQG